MVRTAVTFTLNSDSIAARICGLVASGCTRNAYSLRAPYAADDFSVTTGATMVWCSSGSARPRGGGRPDRRALLRPLPLPLRLPQRRKLHHDGIGPQDLVRGGIAEPHHVHVRDVATREVHVVRVGGAGREHQHLPLGDPELAEQLDQRFRLRLLVRERIDHQHRPLARPGVQRGLLRELAHLFRNAEPIVARMRPEYDPAVPPVRRANRALPRTAGALLAPRLLG